MEENSVTLKIVVPKLKKVNHLVNEVTIGPDARRQGVKKIVEASPKRNARTRALYESEDVTQVPTREFIKVLDLQRQTRLQNCLSSRLHIFNQFEQRQKAQQEQNWERTLEDMQKDVMKIESDILQASEQFELNQVARQELLKQQTQTALLRMKEKQEQIKEKERQKKALLQNINELRLTQQKFYKEWQDILTIIKNFGEDRKNLASRIDLSLLQILPTEIGGIIEKCKVKNGNIVNNITEEDIQKSYGILQKTVEFKNELNKIYEECMQQKQNTPTNTPKHPDNLVNLPEQIETATSGTSAKDSENPLANFISLQDIQVYTELSDFLDNYKKLFSEFEDDQTHKAYRFDLKKAINIPVNSLSGINAQHITDKYNKLCSLLRGQTIVLNGKEINANGHPQGILFCTDLLAKKFVLQGDLIVASNPESAFCYASVILSLWNDFPDFGRLLLGYFHKMCPYLVPYYIPKQVGQSDEEFYTKLGYQYTDGEIEKQDKFLKRMTGIMKLYFTILISKPKQSHPSSPHNLAFAWKWLASFLRLEPQMDITPTALHVFLETVGFDMDNKYGLMFQKVLKLIIQVFLPKCQQIQCTGGALTRLELLLTEYLKTGTFAKPNGYQENTIW